MQRMQCVSGRARKHSRRSRMYILLAPRWFLVGLLTTIAGVLVRLSCAWSTFALGTLLGVGLPVVHATFRCVCGKRGDMEGGGHVPCLDALPCRCVYFEQVYCSHSDRCMHGMHVWRLSACFCMAVVYSCAGDASVDISG